MMAAFLLNIGIILVIVSTSATALESKFSSDLDKTQLISFNVNNVLIKQISRVQLSQRFGFDI